VKKGKIFPVRACYAIWRGGADIENPDWSKIMHEREAAPNHDRTASFGILRRLFI